jgi:CBS domain-containing membrane protein
VIATLGASAVLLFATPHSPLSQPWPVLGGHLVSGTIGIACYQWIPQPWLAAAAAVALAIFAMYYLRCLHPPGGATALTTVIGSEQIHALGYEFLLVPIAINIVLILLCAVAFNAFFAWRRYPASWIQSGAQGAAQDNQPEEQKPEFSRTDLEYALRQMNSYVDVSEDDLARIYALALQHAQSAHVAPERIQLAHFYSNGRYGDDWEVRQVIDESAHEDPNQHKIIYRVVAGKDRRAPGTCTRAELARWAKHEVIRNENSWQRIS